MDKQTGDIIKEIAKQQSKEVYNDLVKPVLKPTGETLGLIPRAVKAALCPLEKWIMDKEYNIDETKHLLEEKLKHMDVTSIVSPEPYIAVPSVQYISYCMDSQELRNMYANLLANSMDKVTKDRVHPSFVEIVKQLSPDEAKILKILFKTKQIPIVDVRYEDEEGRGFDVMKKFSNIGELADCEYPYDIEKYLDNLERLGLVKSTTMDFFSDEKLYDELRKHDKIKNLEPIPENYIKKGNNKIGIENGICSLTSFGISFCEICIIDKE